MPDRVGRGYEPFQAVAPVGRDHADGPPQPVAEFYERVQARGATSDVEVRLRDTTKKLKKTIANKNKELAMIRQDVPALVRAVHQLTLENQEGRLQTTRILSPGAGSWLRRSGGVGGCRGLMWSIIVVSRWGQLNCATKRLDHVHGGLERETGRSADLFDGGNTLPRHDQDANCMLHLDRNSHISDPVRIRSS
ncbi:hypothetical protein [Nonomuraea sp. NEAU-A123]|uniref:hypothetical protein n=1 Tax=Nonomuraea sp. NEAU-A123 TaxID=2839649 RepID=UPI001BE49D2D|nr:hypothetical protein [Nonomuraea sp. NEAU-A123]MBT2225655.1 hypothetical protein [Nonomuraea sp. NEAU-A123]